MTKYYITCVFDFRKQKKVARRVEMSGIHLHLRSRSKTSTRSAFACLKKKKKNDLIHCKNLIWELILYYFIYFYNKVAYNKNVHFKHNGYRSVSKHDLHNILVLGVSFSNNDEQWSKHKIITARFDCMIY